MADDVSDESTAFDCLSVVKTILGFTDTSKDDLLSTYIEITRQTILNYCNLTVIPSALNYTFAIMVVDLYRDIYNRNKTINNVATGNISVIEEDGRKVQFDYSTDSSSVYTTVEEKVSKSQELKRYRKLYRV